MKQTLFYCLFPLWAVTLAPALAQSQPDPRRELEELVRKNGEIYVATERFEPAKGKDCRVEDVFTNSLLAKGDSLTIIYANHTESFCEAFVLNSQFVYTLNLCDADPAKIVLAQRTYKYDKAKLLEGQPSWFEVHLSARGGKQLISRRDVINRQTETASTLRILFTSKVAASRGLALLRELVAGEVRN
jgi:hypothetical protein